MSELDELGSGIVSVPLAIMYACGVLKYDEAKLFNQELMTAEEPNTFADLCMMLKKAREKVSEELPPHATP